MIKHLSGLVGGGLLFVATQASLSLFPASPPAATALLALACLAHGAIGFLRIGGYEAWRQRASSAATLCMALAAAVTAVGIAVSWMTGRVFQLEFGRSTSLTLAMVCVAGLLALSLHAFRQAQQTTTSSR